MNLEALLAVVHTNVYTATHTFLTKFRGCAGGRCLEDLDLVQVNNCLYCSPATVGYGDKLFTKAPVCLLHPTPSMAASSSQQDPLVPGQRCQLGAQIVTSPGQGPSICRTDTPRFLASVEIKPVQKSTFQSSWLKALVAWKLVDCLVLWPSFIWWECLHMTDCVVHCG